MILLATAEAARTHRRRAVAGDGMGFWHNLATGEANSLVPMAFLVEQDPGEVAHSHYHQAD